MRPGVAISCGAAVHQIQVARVAEGGFGRILLDFGDSWRGISWLGVVANRQLSDPDDDDEPALAITTDAID